MHQSHKGQGKKQCNNLYDNSDEHYWETYPQCET